MFAYVRANWFERRALDRMMRAKRHNLRPAHNWPGPRKYRASYVLRAKGRPNPDTGPQLGLSPFAKWLLRPTFNQLDGINVSVGTLACWQGYWVTGITCLVVLTLVSLYLSHRLRVYL